MWSTHLSVLCWRAHLSVLREREKSPAAIADSRNIGDASLELYRCIGDPRVLKFYFFYASLSSLIFDPNVRAQRSVRMHDKTGDVIDYFHTPHPSQIAICGSYVYPTPLKCFFFDLGVPAYVPFGEFLEIRLSAYSASTFVVISRRQNIG